jgi:hypothetical protein
MSSAMIAASHSPAQPRATTRRDPLGAYVPQSLSIHSERRYRRLRSDHYLRKLKGRPPTEDESDIIAQLCEVGWDKLVLRAEAKAATDQRLRTDLWGKVNNLGQQQIVLRRELDRVIANSERSLAAAAPKEPTLLDLHNRAREAAR